MKYIFLMLICMGQPVMAQVGCEAGFKSFTQNLHPTLKANCASCHGDQGTAAVRHSVTDPAVAYAVSLKLVDFMNGESGIETSRFVKKVDAQHWLDQEPESRGVSGEVIRAVLKSWFVNGENACALGYKYQSKSIDISTLENVALSKFVSLSLSVKPSKASTTECNLSFEIQRFSVPSNDNPGSYRVKNPTIVCKGEKLAKIKKIRFLINQTSESYENIYDSVDAEIKPNSEPKLLSAEQMILIQRGPADFLTVAFDSFSVI